SAPNSFRLARRASLVDEPITTFAPMSLAICKPIRPTPELAPWIITLSPARSRPAVTSALCSVMSETGSVAACSKLMPLGIGVRRRVAGAQWAAGFSGLPAGPGAHARAPGLVPFPLAPISPPSARPSEAARRANPAVAAVGDTARGGKIGAIERGGPHLHQHLV